MEIAPTSYLRVNGASIVDDSDTAVRLQGPCLGGWMNMENFVRSAWSLPWRAGRTVPRQREGRCLQQGHDP